MWSIAVDRFHCYDVDVHDKRLHGRKERINYMNILLLCNAGLSTSIVVAKMKNELGEDRKDWKIEAHAADEIDEYIDQFDVVLIGPQIGYRYEQLKQTIHKPIAQISQLDYALGNGKNVLMQAISLQEEIQ